ncbi:sensor histidine kinase [Streptosporangium roseum]|uniref:Anti-sigma regulatory factor, serine/threonine protein kinase n=1 Tax=Streptosporangium roseum (strain ATCC 12428 / DSM 43021 / JCM 3005 / KCTC 9067 / NCIMB 10171 / NRRL 2505 / NI 9100) TaxID=479432 RepID=D2B5R6_STRRD|nr:sensor histidine kinase [Streptosporangium roseum]ACZ91370.1 putative anti-sigma regulatory factor, serine/threonine protein kinase [Streptosporangium roseum DSM 43021]
MTTTTTTTVDPFVHPALFYRGARQYLDGTVPFIREGLAAGEPVAVAVPPQNVELLRAELGEAASEVRFLDMTQAGRNPGRIIPGVLRAFADLHPAGRVRIIGEPIWAGRSVTEYPACVQHEALINLAFSGRAVTILCPYDLDGLDPSVIEEAEMTHPILQDGSGLRTSPAYAPERIIQDYNRPLPDPPDAASLGFAGGDLGRVRDFVVGHAARMGLSGERLEDLRLIASELAANSLDYGGGSGTVRIWGENGQVAMDVTDAGHILDPLAGRRPVDPRQRGSRGLLVTNLLSDLVRIHTSQDGTTIRVYFSI